MKQLSSFRNGDPESHAEKMACSPANNPGAAHPASVSSTL